MSGFCSPLPPSWAKNQAGVLWKNTALHCTCVCGRKGVLGKLVFPKSQVFDFITFLTFLQGKSFACVFPMANNSPQARPENGCHNKALVPLLLSFAFFFLPPAFLFPWSPASLVQYVALVFKRCVTPAPLEGALICCGAFWLSAERFLRHTQARKGKSSGGGNEGEQNGYSFLMLYLL